MTQTSPPQRWGKPWLALCLPIVVAIVATLAYWPRSHDSASTLVVESISKDPWDVIDHLGGNSPWRPKTKRVVANGSDVPSGCIVDQIHMMSRHAERFPTVSPGIRMLELYQRMRKANITFKDELAFFNDWDFFAPHPSQQFEQLVTTGKFAGSLEAFAAGVGLKTKYTAILEEALSRGKVSFWASDSNRVIQSALYFATGLFGNAWEGLATLHIIPETVDRGADTLTPGRGCPRYGNGADPYGHQYGAAQLQAFQKSYLPPIIHRMRGNNPEFVFTESEIYSMQEICGFELLAKGSSEWCQVFTHQEWEAFEYARDVLHFYRAGPGNKYGPTMGWLWLNATASLLRQGPEVGPMFLTFNHDGDIVALLAALNIFPQTPDLPTTQVRTDRIWRMSDVVPMGGRIVFERLVCSVQQECWNNGPLYPNHVYCTPPTNHTFVRVAINEGIVALPGCDKGPGSSCLLEDFLNMVERRGEEVGNFAELCGLSDDAPRKISFLHQ